MSEGLPTTLIPDWTPIVFMNGPRDSMALYADDVLGVEMVLITPRSAASGKSGKQRTRYAIRGRRDVFLTEDALIDALESQASTSIKLTHCCPNCGTDVVVEHEGRSV